MHHTNIHTLLLGTNTSRKERDYLLVAKARVPMHGREEAEEFFDGGDEDHEVGCSVRIERQIPHEGEVNRARGQAQIPNIVATRSTSGEVYVFDIEKQGEPFGADEGDTNAATSQSKKPAPLGLAWNPTRPGVLLTGGFDTMVYSWDINGRTSPGGVLKPVNCSAVHKADVEDVAWHPASADVFASVGDDRRLVIGDIRTKGTSVTLPEAHGDHIFTVAFSPRAENLIATGAKDRKVLVRDLRCLKDVLYDLSYHKKDVVCLQWSPHDPALLLSGGLDRRVLVWIQHRKSCYSCMEGTAGRSATWPGTRTRGPP